MAYGNTMGRMTRRVAFGSLTAALLTVTACSDILNVDAPTQVPADLLDDPAHANLLVQGVVGDFDCALGGYIVSQGLLGDELHDGTFTASRWPTPSRTLSGTETYGTSGCTGLGVYSPLSTAPSRPMRPARGLSAQHAPAELRSLRRGAPHPFPPLNATAKMQRAAFTGQ